jgi:predicted nucleic acid-binding protein
MKVIFVDTFYWIALINKGDTWYHPVRIYSKNLANVKLVTTEEILIETVNFFASFPKEMKQAVYQLVSRIIQDVNIQVIPQTLFSK